MKKDEKTTKTDKKEAVKVGTEKQRYYFPQEGVVIEATSLGEAILLKNKK